MDAKRLCLTLVLAGLTLLSGSPVAAHGRDDDDSLRRQTPFGPVVGVEDSATTGTYAWKGVPFAKSPVGALRCTRPWTPIRGRSRG